MTDKFLKPYWIFIVLGVLTFPLLFRNAIVHNFPMGYAGLFTQMAEQIADANFSLPIDSPYYGPGGIPFAYPPLGLYLLAVFIKIIGSYYIYLRWIPPILSLLSVILVYILSWQKFDSPLIALFISLILATSTDLYVAHTWSSGIVRATAFNFLIIGMYFCNRAAETKSNHDMIYTGIFFGLIILSHLAYALFLFLYVFLLLSDRKLIKWIKDVSIIGLAGSILSAIWIVPIMIRHGRGVFLGAFNSHGGESLQDIPFGATYFLHQFTRNLSPISDHPLLFFLLIVGFVFFIVQKRYREILFFSIIVLIFPENARFVFFIGSLFMGGGLWFLMKWASTFLFRKWDFDPDAKVFILTLPIMGLIWWNGFAVISSYSPFLTDSAIDLQRSADDIFTADKTKYLALLAQDEAEWMPFLLKREPLVAQWGSEWLGQYDRQTSLMLMFQQCRKEKDWSCVESAFDFLGERPHYVITYRIEKKINDQISDTKKWADIYSNNRYIVWQAIAP